MKYHKYITNPNDNHFVQRILEDQGGGCYTCDLMTNHDTMEELNNLENQLKESQDEVERLKEVNKTMAKRVIIRAQNKLKGGEG